MDAQSRFSSLGLVLFLLLLEDLIFMPSLGKTPTTSLS